MEAGDREGPSSEELLAGEYKKQRQKKLVAALAAVAVLAAGVAVFVVQGGRKAEARAKDAYASVCQCLFGGSLADGESPSLRYRTVQLGAMGYAELERAPVEKVPWPQRCGYRVQELMEAAKDAGLSKHDQKDLPYWADALAKVLKSPQGHILDATEPMEAMFAEAQQAGLTPGQTSEPGPPPPPSPLTITDLLKLRPISKKPFPLEKIELELHPGERRHAIVQHEGVAGSPLLCSYDDKSLACRELPEAIGAAPGRLSLFATTARDAAPLVFAGEQGEGGVFRSDTGQRVIDAFTFGGHVAADGTAVLLVEDKGAEHPAWVVAKGDAKAEKEPLDKGIDVGAVGHNAQILWDQLLLRGHKADDAKKEEPKKDDEADAAPPPEPHLFAMSIDASGKVGEPEDLGAVSFGASSIVGCRSKASTIALMDRGHAWAATFHAGGRWSPAMSAPVPRGDVLSCDDAGFSMTYLTLSTRDEEPWDVSWRQSRCTAAGCDTKRAGLKDVLAGGLELAPRERMVTAMSIGDAIAVAWVAGERGGVRMRVGGVDALAKASDVVVFDDLVEGGKLGDKSVVVGLRFLPGSGYALLLLSTTRGVFAVRVSKDGAFDPLGVTD